MAIKATAKAAMDAATAVSGGATVFKGFNADVSLDDSAPRQVKFVISTQDPDRDNDIVMADGWDLSNYVRNPVVLWAHSHKDLPIGKCVAIGMEAGRLVATAEFATHPLAETVFQLIKGGFMRATSVGFRALDASMNEQRQGIDFKRQELLEFSVVPVPANPHALIAAEAGGIELKTLRSWMDETAAALPGGWSAKASVGEITVKTNVTGDAAAALADIEAAIDRVTDKAVKLEARLAAIKATGGLVSKDLVELGGTVEPIPGELTATEPVVVVVNLDGRTISESVAHLVAEHVVPAVDPPAPVVVPEPVATPPVEQAATDIVDLTVIPDAQKMIDFDIVPEVMVDFEIIEPGQKLIDLDDPKSVEAALQLSLTRTLGSMGNTVRDEVERAVNRLRGRVD